jgi:IS605 OrfB family transposase
VTDVKTYVTDELASNLKHFIQDYSRIYRSALVDAVNRRRDEGIDQAQLNTYVQQTYSLNKRQASAVIIEADGMITGAKECRVHHIHQLEGKLKSAKEWLRKKDKQLKDSRKFYRHKNWQAKKASPQYPIACSLDSRRTNWQSLRFGIHHKKRYIAHLEHKIQALKKAPVRVAIPKDTQAYFVGSKGETWGNQVCQFDGKTIQIRVPQCLEAKHGEYITAPIKPFRYGHDLIVDALNTTGTSRTKSGEIKPIRYGVAMTYRFYYKDFRWFMAVSFEQPPARKISKSRRYGCIGIDINPQSIGWAYVDSQGNLKASSQIKFDVAHKRRGKTKALVGEVVKQLTTLALTYCCPIVCESLDFNRKKEDLRERGRKYARMLSNFAYRRLLEALSSRCNRLGLELIEKNPAYSSLIGLVKYARMYGLRHDEAAALVIARRGMNLSERLPRAITALVEVNSARHVWHGWSQVNKKLTGVRRHTYYGISNWELLINPVDEETEQSATRSTRKCKR